MNKDSIMAWLKLTFRTESLAPVTLIVFWSGAVVLAASAVSMKGKGEEREEASNEVRKKECETMDDTVLSWMCDSPEYPEV